MALASQSHTHPSVNEQPLPPLPLQGNGPQPPRHLQLSPAQGLSGLQLGSSWAQPCSERLYVTERFSLNWKISWGLLGKLTSANQILHFQMLPCRHPWCGTLWGTAQLVDLAPPETSLCKENKQLKSKETSGRCLDFLSPSDHIPISSLKVSSIFVCSGELPPMNSDFTSRSSSSRWRTSFCRDFLNHGPLSWSERRSGMGNRTARPSNGAFTVSDTWQLVGVWLSSRKTSVKALCCEMSKEKSNYIQVVETVLPFLIQV